MYFSTVGDNFIELEFLSKANFLFCLIFIKTSSDQNLCKPFGLFCVFISIFISQIQLLEQSGTYRSPSQMASAHSTDSYVNAKYDIFLVEFSTKTKFIG